MKFVSRAAVLLGAFLLVLAALSKFYMYDRLAVAPANTQTTSISATAPGDDAEYLDIAAGLKISNGPLQSTRIVEGNVKASEQASDDLGRDIDVWDTYSCTAPPTFDCSGGGVPLSATNSRVAFDAHTGEAVEWDGTRQETNGETEDGFTFEGQFFKFPFNTEKKTYQFWDGTLGKATDAEYVGEDSIDGLKVYNFEQKIDPVMTGTIDVPASLVGQDGDGNVTADRYYSNVRTFSVEPTTGVIIVGGEDQDGYLELDGQRVLTTTAAKLVYTDENTQDTVDEYKPKAQLLGIVNTGLPIGGAIVGIVLIGLGLALGRRKGEPAQHA